MAFECTPKAAAPLRSTLHGSSIGPIPRPGLISDCPGLAFASGGRVADTCPLSSVESNSRPAVSLRPVLGGVSLLLAVALAIQASAAFTQAAALRAGTHGTEVLRLAAVRPVQQFVLSLRRQVQKSVRVVLAQGKSELRIAGVPARASGQVHEVRRLLEWQTSLPPPAPV